VKLYEAADERLERERAFHDSLGNGLVPEAMPPRGLSVLDRKAIAIVGDVRGTRVLDLGCGDGELTLDMARRGADVAAVDLSPGMVAVAKRRLEVFCPGATAEFVVAPAEALPFPDASFDVVIGRFILHHLDMDQAPREIARVLRPGGVAVFSENSGRNPVLRFARNHVAGRFGVARYGTEDEHPLERADLDSLGRAFTAVDAVYPVFDFFGIFDRQVLRFRWKRATAVCRAADRAIWRYLPWARSWSFRMVIRATA
jgi:SAM-dependent methyltransferase